MESEVGATAHADLTPAREWALNVSAVAAFIWAFKVVQFVIPVLQRPASLSLSTDDAMRLAEVRDLLAGQSWFDLMQWRMNVPYGLAMHWSRLIDAPIAGLILFFRLFLSPQSAEIAAISIWPLLSLLAVWLALGRIAETLAGKKSGVIAVLFGAAGSAVLGYFVPGVIDHHNVQVALTLWTVACVTRFEHHAAAIGAAILSVLSLAISLEVLPYVITTAIVVVSIWIARGGEVTPSVRRFGMTLVMTALVMLIGFTSNRERLSMACDAFSGFYATLAAVTGLGLTALTYVWDSRQTIQQRALLAASLALTLIPVVGLIAPACFMGPYGNVSPRIAAVFLSRVEEVQSPVLNGARDWPFFFYGYIYAAIALAGCALATRLVETRRRSSAMAVAAFAAISFAVMTVEVRGVLFALLLGLPGLAATIQLLIERWTRPGWRAALATIVALIVFSNVTFVYATYAASNLFEPRALQSARASADRESRYCYGPSGIGQLAQWPAGRVVAFLDQGPAILVYSRSSVVGGPYHRNENGILDTFDLLTKSPAVGAQIARRRGIDYVMVCRTSYDYDYYLGVSGPNGLLGRLASNRVPNWLSPLRSGKPDKNLAIYQVVHSRLSR